MPLDQVDVDKYDYDKNTGELRPNDKEMSFLDHLEELRWHIIRSLIAILIGGIGLFIFNDWYFGTVLLGPTNQDFISYQLFCSFSEWLNLGGALCMEIPEFEPQAIKFAEQFITAVKMAFIGGFVAAFPYVFYEVWRFIKPGLYPKERKVTRGIVFICSTLFLLGILFGYFIIAPFAVNFLMGFTVADVANAPTLSSVITYMVMFTLPAGIIFELPVLIYFLAKIGLVTARDMRKYRRHSIIGILALSALITPPDVVTQFLIGIPLWVLYEASIVIAIRAGKAYQKELE